MAEDSENEVVRSNITDMNGNHLAVGDLVMVLLDKPAVAGFVVEINEASILDPRAKNQFGVIVVHGIIRMALKPGQNVLANTAKLVHPQSQGLVDAIAEKLKGRIPTPLQHIVPHKTEGPSSQQQPEGPASDSPEHPKGNGKES